MRPALVRALTVAFVIAGGAAAMALPKLVVDVPDSEPEAMEIALPAPSTPTVIRVSPDIGARPASKPASKPAAKPAADS